LINLTHRTTLSQASLRRESRKETHFTLHRMSLSNLLWLKSNKRNWRKSQCIQL